MPQDIPAVAYPKSVAMTDSPLQTWQAFIDGPLYPDSAAPWRADPAFAVVTEHAGLRDGIGGNVAATLRLLVHMALVMARVDLLALMQSQRPAYGLCLGFGMNALEPYEVLQGLHLDRVHAYEWIAEHVIEAAQMLCAFPACTPELATRVRLHHGTLSDLRALDNGSIRFIYAANVFHYEVPMTPDTFARSVQEMLRVLASGGLVMSRGSSGALEAALAPHGHVLLDVPQGVIFQKHTGERT